MWFEKCWLVGFWFFWGVFCLVWRFVLFCALKQQKFTLSQFWRQEVPNQGACTIVPLRPVREPFLVSSQLVAVSRQPLVSWPVAASRPFSIFRGRAPCVCFFTWPAAYEDTLSLKFRDLLIFPLVTWQITNFCKCSLDIWKKMCDLLVQHKVRCIYIKSHF